MEGYSFTCMQIGGNQTDMSATVYCFIQETSALMMRHYILYLLILTNAHWAAHERGLSHCALWHTMHEMQLYPFHVQLVQGLWSGNHNLHFQFCQ